MRKLLPFLLALMMLLCPALAEEEEEEWSLEDSLAGLDQSLLGDIFINVEEAINVETGEKPVVIIDYLQVIAADKDPETGRKMTETRQIIDHNITELKRISRDLDITVILISSVNRANYMQPIDFESLKESGGIEYTCDVCWGLQLQCLNDPIFEKE